MKKLMIPLVCIFALGLCSFLQGDKQTGFKKIGKNLYEVKTPIAMKEVDKKKFLDIMQKEYGIKSFKDDVTITWDKNPKPKPGFPGSFMAEKKIGNNIFVQTMFYEGEQDDVCQRCVNCGGGCDGRKSGLEQIVQSYMMK